MCAYAGSDEMTRHIMALVGAPPDDVKAWAAALLALPDPLLADLYSMWSEEMWAAGWMSGEEEHFAEWLLSLPERSADGPRMPERRGLADYEVDGVAKMREVFRRAAWG
jgi:hypothetical protein